MMKNELEEGELAEKPCKTNPESTNIQIEPLPLPKYDKSL